MKKYILIFTVSLFTLITSCGKENLDLNPFDSVGADVALNTPSDFESAVNGLYRQMIFGSYGASMMSFPDVLTDNLIFVVTGRQTQKTTFEWLYNANNTQQGFMSQSYTVIQQANFILENIDRIPDGAQKNNIIAQAKAARGLAHFMVNNVFAKIPTQSGDANGSLGIPIMTSSDIRRARSWS